MTVTNDQTSTITGTGSLIACGLGVDLTITSNTVSVDNSVHRVLGSGTLTTISWASANSTTNPAVLYLIRPTGATWVFGTGGNITLPPSGAPVGETEVAIPLVWDGTAWRLDKESPRSGVVNVMTFGAKGDGVTDDHAAVQAAIDATSKTANATIYFPPSVNGYLFKSPLVVNKNFMTLAGAGFFQTVLLFDLSAYSGAYPHYYIILGDSLSTPSDITTVQGNSVRDFRIVGTGGTGAILAWRSTNSKVENVEIVGTGISYGIRVVASDSRFTIKDCTIGESGPTLAPDVCISVEDGSNQTVIEGCIASGGTTCIQVFNSVGTLIKDNGAIGVWAIAASTYYGIRIRNDQTVPAWLTWINANVGGNIHITNNWFEPDDFAGATVHDIYVGYGVPTVHAITGTVVRDNFFLESEFETRYSVTVDYADQTVVDTVAYWGTVTKLLNITSHATLTKYDIQNQSTYNTAATSDAALISDSGTQSTTMGHWKTVTPFDAGNFTSDSGTWVVGSGDVLTYAYSTLPRLMSLSMYLVNTDVTGTPQELRIAVPDGYTIGKTVLTMCRLTNSGSTVVGMAVASAGNAYVSVFKIDAANLAADAGGTGVQFQIQFEIQ